MTSHSGWEEQEARRCSALRRIGWGLVLVALDFRAGTLDVLPDVVGYLMIVSGCVAVGAQRLAFGLAAWLAALLAIFGLPFELFFSLNVPLDAMAMQPLGWHLYMQGLSLLHLVMAYWLLHGFLQLALEEDQKGMTAMAASIRLRRGWYLVIYWLALVSYPFLFTMGDAAVIVQGGVAVLLLLMELLLLRIAFRLAVLKL